MATREAKVAHIWRRLGFGPTKRDVDAGVSMGPSALVDSLFAKPHLTFAQSGFPTGADADDGDANAQRQLELMAFGPVTQGAITPAGNYNPLQERIAWILQGLVVVGIADSVYVPDMRDHVKLLRTGLGITYRQLLTSVSTRPGMLKYLTGDRNTKDHPNQNYGRELLELFSLGRTDPATGNTNYTQTDVVEVSRALSGWQYNWSTGGTYFSAGDWDNGNKTFLGAPRGAAGLNEVIAALVTQPSWKRYVPARLYKELTGLTATPQVLAELAPVWGTAGNLKATAKAIAKRPEFLSDQAIYAKTKTPVERLVAAARVLKWPKLATDDNIPWMLNRMAQHPFAPPNVSGWPKGDQWLNATNLHTWSEMANSMAMRGFDWSGAVVGPINGTVNNLHTNATAQTAATYACRLAGITPVSARTTNALTDYATSGSWTKARAAGVLNLLFLSPEFLAN